MRKTLIFQLVLEPNSLVNSWWRTEGNDLLVTGVIFKIALQNYVVLHSPGLTSDPNIDPTSFSMKIKHCLSNKTLHVGRKCLNCLHQTFSSAFKIALIGSKWLIVLVPALCGCKTCNFLVYGQNLNGSCSQEHNFSCRTSSYLFSDKYFRFCLWHLEAINTAHGVLPEFKLSKESQKSRY